MSSETNENILFNRRNSGTVHKDISKQVSFNEDVLNGCKINKDLKSVHCFNNFKVDESNLALKERLNDKCQEAESCNIVDKYDICKSQDILSTNVKYKQSNVKSVKRNPLCSPLRKRNILKKDFPPFTERGTPEGQEDPKRYSSTLSLNESETVSNRSNEFSDMHDTTCICHEKHKISKSLLIRRFLQSIPSKVNVKEFSLLDRNRRVTSLYIKNIKRNELYDHSVLTNVINDEIDKNVVCKNDAITSLNPLISTSSNNVIYKVYKVLNVDGCPSLAVITGDSLYFIKRCDTNSYVVEYFCDFERLVAAVMNPFSQIVIVVNNERDRFFINTGTSPSLASNFICHLEIAMRRFCLSKRVQFSFNVALIRDLKQMNAFYDGLTLDTFTKDEVLIAQYSIWLQEDLESTNFPLGPEKEGHLMTKISIDSTWFPAYICLREGVLYVFKKISSRVPTFSIPLQSVFCEACQRIRDSSERPHSFKIMLEGNSTFYFGTADEAEMTDWIRVVNASASSQIPSHNVSDHKNKLSVVSCFVTLTSCQILLHRFPNDIISRALLDDVIHFRKSGRTHSLYCLIELNCREASEINGDWIFHFVSKDSYDDFCDKFSRTGCMFTKSELDNRRLLTNRNDKLNAQIRSSWDSFFV